MVYISAQNKLINYIRLGSYITTSSHKFLIKQRHPLASTMKLYRALISLISVTLVRSAASANATSAEREHEVPGHLRASGLATVAKQEASDQLRVSDTARVPKNGTVDTDTTRDLQGLHWGSFRDNGCKFFPGKAPVREYVSVLWGIPWGHSWEAACASMPATVRGQFFPHPTACDKASVSDTFAAIASSTALLAAYPSPAAPFAAAVSAIFGTVALVTESNDWGALNMWGVFHVTDCGGCGVTCGSGGSGGFCNWGPDGTGASSVCAGGAQGGPWCNANGQQCENDCGGKWCSGGSDGFCNWGPDGTGGSSVCAGGAQGGPWCNANAQQCENGCGGKWCT